MAIPSEKKKYSYADYLTWNEGERIELIDGEIFNMSPAPSRRHQQVLRGMPPFKRKIQECMFIERHS